VTVEEILVKFTGDATSLTSASDKAKNKTKDMRDEVEKLDRIMARAKVGTTGYEMTLAKLEATARKYSTTLEKLNAQEKKIGASVGSPKLGGGYGGGGGGRLGIAGSFLAGAGVSAATALGANLHDSAKSLFSQAEKAIQNQLSGFSGGDGIKSIEQSERIQKEEEDRADFLAGIRNRQIGDRAHAVDREGAGRSPTYQLQGQVKLQADLARQIEQSKKSQDAYRSAIESTNSAFHVVRPSMKMAYDEANRGLKEEVAHYKALESAAHAAGEKIKDIQSQAWQAYQQARHQLAGIGEGLSGRILGLDPNAAPEDIEMNRLREDARKRIQELPNETQANKDKLLANEMEALAGKFRLLKMAREDAFNMDFLRGEEKKLAQFGRKAGEAFILGQRAIGKEVPADRAKQILDASYKLEGLELARANRNPFEKAADEMGRLNLLREQGAIDNDTYGRAMREISKTTREPAAASRSATGFGSAEHSARIDAYSRVMGQSGAQKDNIERARKEAADGPLAKAQAEGNGYLKQIVKNTTGAVNVQVANLGND